MPFCMRLKIRSVFVWEYDKGDERDWHRGFISNVGTWHMGVLCPVYCPTVAPFLPCTCNTLLLSLIRLLLPSPLLLHQLSCCQMLGLQMNCTDVVMAPQLDVATLQRTLYCGYYQARCNGSTTTAQ